MYFFLKFLEAAKEDEVDSFPTPATYQPIKATTIQTTETPMRKFKIETPPNFTAKLKSKTVTAGNSIKFMCTVTGIPNPKVTWYRDNRDVTKESRYLIRVRFLDNVYVYYILTRSKVKGYVTF